MGKSEQVSIQFGFGLQLEIENESIHTLYIDKSPLPKFKMVMNIHLGFDYFVR